MENDSSPYDLVSQAVDLACERNPNLILEPYYQMKNAALILAEMLVERGVAGVRETEVQP